MAERPVRSWLVDIRAEIAGIRGLVRETNADSFAQSRAMKRAVQHALLIIAEAAKHVPPDLKAAHPKVPWQKVHGLGNLLRHSIAVSIPRSFGPSSPIISANSTTQLPRCSTT